MEEIKKEHESLMDMAAGVYDIVQYLRKRGVISLNSYGIAWDIMLTVELFTALFGEVKPDAEGLRHANWNGLRIVA